MRRSTDKKDINGRTIYENDILTNTVSGYSYEVKYGEFTIPYTKPFPIKCLGFYVQYDEPMDNSKQVDTFAMLNCKNLEVVNSNKELVTIES